MLHADRRLEAKRSGLMKTGSQQFMISTLNLQTTRAHLKDSERFKTSPTFFTFCKNMNSETFVGKNSKPVEVN